MTSEAFQLPTSSYHCSPIYALLSTLPCPMASSPRIMTLLGILQKTSVAWTHPSKCQQGFVHSTAFSPISPHQSFTFCTQCYSRYFSFSSECFLYVALQPAPALLHQAKEVKTQEVPVQLAFICPASLPLLWINLSPPCCLCCLLFRATFYTTIPWILGMLCLLESFKCSSKGFPKTGQLSKGKTDSNGLAGANCGS